MEKKEANLTKKYVGSTALALIRVLLVRGTSLIYLFLMARWLTTTEMGIVTAVAVGTSFVGGIITPGIAWVLQQKVITEKTEEQSWKLSYQIFSYGLYSTVIFAPLFSFIYLSSIAISITSETGILFILISISLCIYQLFLGLERAFLNLELNVLIGAVQSIANFIGALFLYYITNQITAIFWGWLLTDIFVIIVMYSQSELSISRSLIIPSKPSKDLIIFSIPVILLFLFRNSRGFLDRYIVLLFFGESQLAIYHLVNRIAKIASEAILTLLISFLPIMTKIIDTRPEKADIVLEATVKVLMHFLAFGVPLLIFCGDPIIAVILGDKYISLESSTILVFSSITIIFTTFNTLIIRVKGARGNVYSMLFFSVIDLVIEAIIILLFFATGLAGTYRAVGIALSVMIANCISFIIMAIKTPEMRRMPIRSAIKNLLLFTGQLLIIAIITSMMGQISLTEFVVVSIISLLSVFILSGTIGVLSEFELDLITNLSKNTAKPFISIYKKIKIL